MTDPWQQIDSTGTARRISESVCWDDSSLVDAIFCRTVLPAKDGSSTTGRGLRVLISCCSAPRSHLELCFLEITEQVTMPIDLGWFNGFFAENGQFRFGFHYNNFQHQCRRPYFRFCDPDHLEASVLYSSPAVLEPAEGQLSSEGFVECQTSDGGHIVVSGDIREPALFIQQDGLEGVQVTLDWASSLCLLNAIHRAATQ